MENVPTMFLIYRDESGTLHYQNWRDIQEVGTLIDPESGEDMPLIGWEVKSVF